MSHRERIVERAATMFAEQGIKSIRMDDVAKSLGMSKRTLYEMFADKEELLYHSVRHLNEVQNRQSREAMQRFEGNIVAIFEGIRVAMKAQPTMHRIMGNLQKFYPALYERIRGEMEQEHGVRLYEMIMGYIDEGLILPQTNVRLSITLLYYTTISIISMPLGKASSESVDRQELLMYAIVNFFRGISTVKGVLQIDEYFAANGESASE